MKRPWYYENGCWKTKGIVNQKELDDWAAFYGHDFQGALARAQSEMKQAFIEAFEPIVNSLERGLEKIERSFRGERIP